MMRHVPQFDDMFKEIYQKTPARAPDRVALELYESPAYNFIGRPMAQLSAFHLRQLMGAQQHMFGQATALQQQRPHVEVQYMQGPPGLPGAPGPQGMPGMPGKDGADGRNAPEAQPVGVGSSTTPPPPPPKPPTTANVRQENHGGGPPPSGGAAGSAPYQPPTVAERIFQFGGGNPPDPGQGYGKVKKQVRKPREAVPVFDMSTPRTGFRDFQDPSRSCCSFGQHF